MSLIDRRYSYIICTHSYRAIYFIFKYHLTIFFVVGDTVGEKDIFYELSQSQDSRVVFLSGDHFDQLAIAFEVPNQLP